MNTLHPFRPSWGLGILLVLLTAAAAQETQRVPVPQKSEAIQFNRDIRPILSENCFTCHGPDKGHRVTEFHFDVEESAKQDLGGGRFAVHAGDPAGSLLVQRITSTDESERMPPSYTGHKLTDRQISLLTDWIRQGAPWEKHWSFVAPKRPAVPAIKASSKIHNPIDNFVIQRLEKEGLQLSPEADRATLLRRVTLDLTGKPPTLGELDHFLADKSSAAYEKVVTRLLQSPQYGERMAVPWLDAARYADTDGYQVDYKRSMWRWRDWVINAFNKNMPFDQFTVEQLAGDLLPNSSLDQKIATAFNRNHRINGEAGALAEEFGPEYVIDRVSTTSTVFLGLTFGCARCHDHKYDPLSQKEFYQLYAYFNNIPETGRARKGNSEPFIKAPTPVEAAELDHVERQIQTATQQMAKLEPAIAAAEAAWLKSGADASAQWSVSRGLAAHYPLDGMPDGIAAVGSKPLPGTKWVGKGQFSKGIAGQAASFDGSTMIEAGDVGGFDDDSKFSVGAWIYPTSANGTIVSKTLDEPESKGYVLQLKDGKLLFSAGYRWIDHALRLEAEKPLELNRWHHVMVTYGGTRSAQGITIYADGEPQRTEVLLDVLNITSRINQPFRIGGGGGPQTRFRGMIDDVVIYNAELTPEEVGILSVPRSLGELSAVPPAQRSQAEHNKIRNAFLNSSAVPAPILSEFHQLTSLREQREKLLESISTVMVMEEMPTPRETHVLLRGVYDQPGDIVNPAVPAILPSIPASFPRNRLGLARWLVDPSNPLTARVTVNRFWQMYFGTGLVKTVDDFGSQGEAPSHPELLDWLATEFERTGWDVKAMQRTIVTSATYRQSSRATPEGIERDPENRLLARGPRFRMPAETVRDQALSIAGLLVDKVGGPSVMPYQPEGLWTDLTQESVGVDRYIQDHGDQLYRRSLYTFWKRTIPPPSMANFDAPSRDSCTVQRGFTNSPLQSLDLMNSTTYLEVSRVLATRMMKEGGKTPADRIAFAFRLATDHRPRPDQAQILSDAFHYAIDRFQSHPGTAAKYVAVGESPRDPALDGNTLAAYTTVASLILNMDETVTKE